MLGTALAPTRRQVARSLVAVVAALLGPFAHPASVQSDALANDLRAALEAGEHAAVRMDLPTIADELTSSRDPNLLRALAEIAFATGEFHIGVRFLRAEVALAAEAEELEQLRANHRLAKMLWWNREPDCIPVTQDLLERAGATEGVPEAEILDWELTLAAGYLRAFRYAEVLALVGPILERAEALDGTEAVQARARGLLAQAAFHVGDEREALEQARAQYAYLVQHSSPDDLHLVDARRVLAMLLNRSGDSRGARQHHEAVLAACERILAEDHLMRLEAMDSLAGVLRDFGETSEALALMDRVLTIRARLQGPTDRAVLRARRNQAGLVAGLGDLDAAIEILEDVLSGWEELEERDPIEFALAQNALGLWLSRKGETSRARELRESSFDYLAKNLPASHPMLLNVRRDMARLFEDRGDYMGSRLHLEALLAALESTLPADHPSVLGAKQNLAVAVAKLGDFEAALPLDEAVLLAAEENLPEGHPDLSAARLNLASTMMDLGWIEESRPLLEQVVATFERRLPPEHPNLALARTNLGGNLVLLGDMEGAIELLELAIGAYEAAGSLDNQDLLGARRNVADAYRQVGRLDEAASQARRLAEGLRIRFARFLLLSARQARSAVAVDEGALTFLLNCTRDIEDPDLARATFELVETARWIATASPAREWGRRDAQLGEWLAEAGDLRARISALAAGWSDPSSERVREEQLRAAVEERDVLETRCRERLAELGSIPNGLQAGAAAAGLPAGSAAVTYRRYKRTDGDRRPAYIAHVLTPGGRLTRIELGDADTVEREVVAWRAAIGAPVGPTRGIGKVVASKANEGVQAAGETLRARLLDPVLPWTGDARRLHVCLDAALHLVPIETLPAAEVQATGPTVGDELEIVVAPSLALFLDRERVVADTPRLLGLGNLDYGSDGSDPSAFAGLPGTTVELEVVGELFARTYPDAPVAKLERKGATKEALATEIERATYLHLATHGWFAGTAEESDAGSRSGWEPMSEEAKLAVVAPMALCGLALSGASQAADASVTGVVTGEELAGYDLSKCELAVLSACDSNVGLRRSGQGILSLQAALHEAGARTAISSLWKIPDEATSRLMELFYSGLWSRGLTTAQALRAAKAALREEGAPVREWGGWVLSGRPD